MNKRTLSLLDWIPLLVLMLVVALWAIVLKDEFSYVLIWWAVLLVIGLLFYPLSMNLFSSFTDKGYLFSKGIGLAITSYMMWTLSFFKLVKMDAPGCWVVVFICGLLVFSLFFNSTRKEIARFNDDRSLFWIFTGESLFLASLGFWTYLRGFNPRIEGLEKFMDYGFVNSIIRSGYVPPKDMWFAGESINYYYFGQYLTAFITRLTGIKTEITYNLMMATLFAFSMALCFAIVTNLLKGQGVKKKSPIIIGGLIGSVLVSLGGNLHSFIYGTLSKWTSNGDSYWFPDATRYIGYNPETGDKTIHEFPIYSFVVSDLHAHVVNMIFVLTLLGVLLAMFRKIQRRIDTEWQAPNLFQDIFLPEMILCGFLIGIFQMSNFWDFPIYLTVTLFTLAAAGLRQYGGTLKMLGTTCIRFLLMVILSMVFTVPFNMTFKKVATGIRLAQDHSMPYQLLVLWGYQLVLVVIFFAFIFFAEQNVIWKRARGKEKIQIRNELSLMVRIRQVLEKNTIEDVFAVILCISAMGLVLIPELVYVKDIYSGEHKRANTMFKLTYQAFIMFGLAAGYILIRIKQFHWKEWKLIVARILAVVMVILPMIYPFYAISSWYKKMDPEKYQSLDGMTFLEKEYPDDYALVQWLNENVQGQPHILESNGDSYTMHGRISMATGLPTVQGWYVHEWLWRDDVSLVQSRVDDVKTIYESDDVQATKALLDKYDVVYIVIGKLEREKFENLKEEKLLNLGTVVFERPTIQLIQVQ